MKRLWEWVKRLGGILSMLAVFLFFLYMAYSVGQVNGFQWLNYRIIELEKWQISVQAQVDSIKTAYAADTLPAVKP